MNTLNKDQIDRLERLYEMPHEDQSSMPVENSGAKLIIARLLVILSIACAYYAICNPNPITLSTSCFLILSLVLVNLVIQRKSRNSLEAKKNDHPFIVFTVGSLSVALAFVMMTINGNNNSQKTSTNAPMLIGATGVGIGDAFQSPASSDVNLGRTVVGPKLPGLSLQKSLVTGHVDANSLTSVMYWTMDFNNTTWEPKEARAKIALPKGAVVSRVTLWVNGVAEEAAFNSAHQTQAAYQWIVNTGRDPVLVTESNEGEVFLQAFPVPQNGKMKVRIGITTPLEVKTRKEFQLMPPHLVQSNFDFSQKDAESELKLVSNATITSNVSDQSVKEEADGRLVLSGVLKPDAFDYTCFTIQRQTDFVQCASRATHSAERSFITERIEQDGNNLRLVTEKTQAEPGGPVAYDFPTASRMSTLWAAQEARKCIELNDFQTAAQLGYTYRIVTKATGATVLESQSDYDYTGLKRDMYSVVSSNTKAPAHRVAGGVPSSVYMRNEGGITDPHGQNTFYNVGLQGATNGTIGPQGGDATSIMGVNTAGTVRVSNLANLEALLNIIANSIQLVGIVGGAILIGMGFFKVMPYHRTIGRLLTGATWVMVGLMSPTMLYCLISAARDANLFS